MAHPQTVRVRGRAGHSMDSMALRRRLWLLVCVALLTSPAPARGNNWVDYHATPPFMKHVDAMPELAGVAGAGAGRGPRWYDYDTSGSQSDSDLADITASSSISLKSHSDSNISSGASSVETKEKRLATRAYRECTPCPLDMIRKHTNIGIKWICGAYQRARRSFKSECMMRYRNCQDGTMFVKVSERRCTAAPHHGRHWFYVYRV